MLSEEELDELDTDVVASVYEGAETVETWYKMVAQDVPSNGRDVTYAHLVNPTAPRRWKRGTPKVKQQIARGSRRVKNDRFEQTIAIDADDVADDTTGLARQELTDLGFESGQKFEQVKDGLAADILINNGTGMDKRPLFGTHKLNPLDNGSPDYLNDFTGMPFSPENVAKARAIIFSQKGPDKLPRKMKATHVMVAPAKETQAEQLFGAAQINGTDNPNKGKAKVIVAPELMSTTANPLGDETWFMLVLSGRKRPLVHQKREPLKAIALFDPRDPNVWERNELIWTAKERFAVAGGYPFTIYRFRP